ncbi:succinylglutamate desuccinylase/aspartoacylase family protein [Pseudonocardia sp. CA-142604]|uniref:succinylglutamate desuccinylase/aspartoacylase family protein n=1 Tax=Pseudonocardia sp. CA-142604 TaxID=3240024 RepID=UPI003D8C62CB
MHELIVPLPDGALAVPYVEVAGKSAGPHLTVIAGVHGAEYTSIAAVREFARALDPAWVHGRITAVPVVNLLSFWERSAFVVPLDEKNLNRSFPGDPGGTFTEVLAHHITEAFIRPTDYLLDLHAGDLPEALEPFVLYDESPVEEQSRRLAHAYGLGHVVRQARAGRTVGGSTSAVAADLGIPSITAEAGQNGILDRASVDRHLTGLANITRVLGIDTRPSTGTAAAAPPVEHDGWVWLRTTTAGWWEPAVAPGTDVDAGDLLGTVSGLLGNDRTEIRAPEAGVPLFVTSSPAVTADGLLMGLARASA